MTEMAVESIQARGWIERSLRIVLEEMAKGKDGEPHVILRRIQKYEAAASNDDLPTHFKTKDYEARYDWPGKTPDEAWRFGETSSTVCRGTLTASSLYRGSPELHPCCYLLWS
jgi:hypothetical protein